VALPDQPAPIDKVRRLIRSKSAQLRRRSDFRRQDREDLEQELVVAVLRRLRRFEEKRLDPSLLLNRIVQQAVSKLIRDQGTRRPPGGKLRSLSERINKNDAEVVRLADAVTRDDLDGRMRRTRGDGDRLENLVADLAELMPRLRPDLHDAVALLLEHTKAEAARQLGLPRTTFYAVAKQLKAIFEH
jgi:RNA polymerase sigma-70 factor (ECF subfamily)